MPEPGHLDIPLTTEKNINTFKDAGGSQESEVDAGNVQHVATSLRYPESQDEVYKARIRFKMFKIEPITFEEDFMTKFGTTIRELPNTVLQKAQQIAEDTASSIEKAATGPEVGEDSTQGLAKPTEPDIEAQIKELDNKGNPSQIFNSIMPKPDLSEPIVSMFVPISVTFNDGAQYDDTAALGVTGGAAMAAMEAGGGVGASILAGIRDGALSMVGLGNNTGIPTGDVARVAATRLTQMAPFVPQGVKNAVSLTTQTTLNPNTRPLFRNVNIRTFTFTFKMIPESKREAAVVERIVKHFRKNVYPEVIPEGVDGFSAAYRFPKLFDISFDMGGKKMGIPKIEKCYLRNVSVTYNSTAATFHEDGQPNEIDMTLTFVERKTLSRKDIEIGGL